MEKISDDLLVKILSFVPTKVAVSTSILSKRWRFLWMWLPKLKYNDYKDISDSNLSMSSRGRYRAFINKTLPLHKAQTLESLCLRFCHRSVYPEDFERWVGIAVSRCVCELNIGYFTINGKPEVLLPSSLYTCKSLVTLKLVGKNILVDVPETVSLPSLKTMQLRSVKYLNEDFPRLLLSNCLVLEDLVIKRDKDDNGKGLVVIVPSLQRLSLRIDDRCSSDGYVIDTPSLKYFNVRDYRDSFSYLIKHMPKLEEADIIVQKDLDKFLESITSAKRLSLKVFFNHEEESMYRAGIVFNQLEHLKLCLCYDYWSKLLFRLLKDSLKLRVLNLYVDSQNPFFDEYERITWSNEKGSVPNCLLKTLETFKLTGYTGRVEERDFLSFLFKNARCLKSPLILC